MDSNPKIKITFDNCHKFKYRIGNISDLEKFFKFLYVNNQLPYEDIKFRMSLYEDTLITKKEVYLEIYKLEKPHWKDGHQLEACECYWKHKISGTVLEFKDTTLEDISPVYARNVFKSGSMLTLMLVFLIFVVLELSLDDFAAILVGCIFFLGLGSIASVSI